MYNRLKEINPTNLVFGIIVILTLAVFAVDLFVSEKVVMNVTVMDAVFSPGKTTVGFVDGTDANGNTTTDTVVATSRDEWHIVIQLADGSIEKTEVSMDVYYRVSVGEYVRLQCMYHPIFKYYSSCQLAGN